MQQKLKILCLHGYRQNSEKFKSQTGALRKILKKQVDFSFISAPLLIPTAEDGEGEDEQRSWWFTKLNSFSSKDETDLDSGFAASLDLIRDTFKTAGPFDGVLGFSQGAALTALLCFLMQNGQIDIKFKFAIIVSGFKSKCLKHSQYYSGKVNLPSLHVIGETDQVIDKELSKNLADCFVNPVFVYHNGGHFVPGISSLKNNYLDFINAQISV